VSDESSMAASFVYDTLLTLTLNLSFTGAINGEDLSDTACVVVRYFGKPSIKQSRGSNLHERDTNCLELLSYTGLYLQVESNWAQAA
jgi:hypothetical protein